MRGVEGTSGHRLRQWFKPQTQKLHHTLYLKYQSIARHLRLKYQSIARHLRLKYQSHYAWKSQPAKAKATYIHHHVAFEA
jgi:hypothetical protein